jgi:SpoVK/Ycf46/Vps4 family AAA+-type ATPase
MSVVSKMDEKQLEWIREFKQGIYGLKKNSLSLRAVTVEDMRRALTKIKPSVTAESLEEFEKYTRDFGTPLASE